MPLLPGKSKEAFEQNVGTELSAGKPSDQALAIAYNMKRSAKRYANGGQVGLSERKDRLKAMLFGSDSAPALDPTDDFSMDDDSLVEEEPQKPSRKDRIRDILSEMRIKGLKKANI